ncbi:MAG TPA: DUF6391 domain-containing protein [Anaerolineales bacterium]|nr:DUF6391 domain-containing protein [Anaerolineales bacterium]
MRRSLSMELSNILELPIISHIRRNHALEHATLHMLAGQMPRTMLMGHSDAGGFWIIGDVPPEALHAAVQEAIARLRAGESQLALHPNCGTNFVTAGALAGLAGAASMLGSGRRVTDKLARLPFTAALATLALIVSQPLGMLLQSHITTSGDPGTLEVTAITHRKQGHLTIHRIQTRG